MTMYILLTILFLLNVFDVYSTKKILEAGGRELNPFGNFFFQRLGLVPGLFVVKGFFLAVLVLAFLYGYVQHWHILVCIAVYIGVAKNNYDVMEDMGL